MLNSKFVRAHFINTSQSTSAALRWTFKLIYEFWGFCVNGTDDLKVPGGFASSGSVAPVSGAVIFPSGFQSGSTVLLKSGTDGMTDLGQPFFNTVNPIFSSTYVGKHIVAWKSGSTSSDDSIYEIKQWINSSSVRVFVGQGGTPFTGSLKPGFTTRTNINYRIIDFNAAANLVGSTTNDGLVLQFNGAGLVNTGQLNSQCRLRQNTTNMSIVLSPSGSWTPISGTFTDSSTETSVNWGSTGTGTGYISLFGAQDYLIAHSRGSWNTAASWLHVEIPARLYPQRLDPNLIIHNIYGSNGINQTLYDTWTTLHPPDGTTRLYEGNNRAPLGDGWPTNIVSSPYRLSGVSNGRYNHMVFNVFQNKFIFMDQVLGLTVTDQFVMSRCRVRRARLTAPIVPAFQRIGDLGEWLHVNDGILWPWDNMILPYNLFLAGN